MRVTAQHWTIAFTVALLAHAGVAAAVLWESPPSGARSAGLGGLEVSLGPVGGAPGATATPVPLPDAESVEPPDATAQPVAEETAEEPPVPPETVEPEPEAVETAEPAEAAEPIEPPEEAPEQPVELAEKVEPEPVEEIEPVETEPVTPDEAVAAVEPPPATPEVAQTSEPEPVVEQPPRPQRKPQLQPAEPQTAAPKTEPAPALRLTQLTAPPKLEIAKNTPSVAGAGGKAGSQASPDAGSADQVSGGGLPGQAADYMALLQAWLHKHKEYPYRARARRQEGTALLYFVMDRDGHVSDSRIQQSSGYKLLDEEVLALIRRAEPLPPPPPEMAGEAIKLVVPVQFFLR